MLSAMPLPNLLEVVKVDLKLFLYHWRNRDTKFELRTVQLIRHLCLTDPQETLDII